VPNKLISLIALPLATAVLVAGALAGCAPATKSPVVAHSPKGSGSAPGSASPSNSPAPSANPSATPTATGPAPLPANVLFKITATVTAPGGASATLVQTVFVPAPITAAQRSTFDSKCAGQTDSDAVGAPWQNNYAVSDVLSSTMTATLNSGSPAWDNKTNGVLADFMSFGVFSGAYQTFEAYCAPGFITIPGTQQAIAPIQSANPAGQDWGWAGEFAAYGFYGGGNAPNGGDLDGKAVVSNCHVEVSPTASANAVAAGWATKVMHLGDGCDYRGPDAP
jgi:hypothetical protein